MEASRAAPPRAQRRVIRRLAALRRREQPEPFERLYREHAPAVYRYALALLANPADAEDVTQTTFLNAYRAFERGERPRRPHDWLIAIAHNVCRMRWRQAYARPREVPLDQAPELAVAGPDDDRPNLDKILEALAGLSFNQRAALVMRELEGRSYAEIADVLDVSVSAVEALVFRARRNLRLRRQSLGALTTAPLPVSLGSSLAAGSGAAVGGGAAVGADLVLKAAAVVAAGAVTAGVGYQTVGAVPSRSGHVDALRRQPAAQARPAEPAAAEPVRRARGAQRPARPPEKLRRAVARTRESRQGADPATPAAEPRPAATEQSAPASTQPPPVQAVTTVVAATAPVLLPPAPSVLPPAPPLPVTVTTPTTPPPPLLP
jgi:RNA polymerase sigma-70 factor (ECF subfamily)